MLIYHGIAFNVIASLFGLNGDGMFFWFQYLIENLDRDLQYAIRVDGKMDISTVINYEDVKNAIMEKVLHLSARLTRCCNIDFLIIF